MPQHYLGIDVGTTAVKALVVNELGSVVGEAESPLEVSVPRPGWAEQNPSDWWHGTVHAVRAACAQADIREVESIGLSGQMHSSVFLDDSDTTLRPAILWNDVRTTVQCRLITDSIGKTGLRRLVGNPALEGFTAPKLLWMRDEQPHLFDRVRSLLLPKDYVRLLMTGEKATEPSDAAGTLLFDIRRGCWSEEMLDALQLDPAILPPVLPSTGVTGGLTTAAAEALGLRPGTPVVGGGADNAAAAVGSGVVGQGAMQTSIGTSGAVVAPIERPRVDPAMRIHSFNHAVADTWYLMGVVLSAGAALDWFRRALSGPSGMPPTYDELTSEAAAVPPGADGLTFLPYLTGERTPHADSNARGVFAGMHTGHHRGHLTRAVMEGVVFALRDSLELMRRLRVDATEAVAVGGGARSSFWRRMQADVLGVPVVTVGPQGGAPYGAAVLSAVGSGGLASVEEACGAWIRPLDRIEPDPETAATYDEAYERYRKLYPRLKRHFSEQAQDSSSPP
ncbi:MAG: xylulokinase [Dehalococcoidia bacterium]|nr:xylulokinase [Dehalococcoidia bacterium]